MSEPIILGIESSCDETGVAIVQGNRLLSNAVSTQIAIHQKYGGVMPEMASRLHTENITMVLEEALAAAKLDLKDVTAIAVTRGPGLIGALHVGLQAAKTLAAIYNKPLIPVHHLAAHIYANEFVKPLVFPLLAIVVSGGNTELVYMEDHLRFRIIGETRDDAIGECYDKVARVLGLPYPGGLPIDKLAQTGKPTYKLPRPLHDHGLDLSYSGLKTAVINLVHHAEQVKEPLNLADLCASFQQTAVGMIIDKSLMALDRFPIRQIVLAGGVSANSLLRQRIKEVAESHQVDVIIPPMWACTDNAAMIALLGRRLYEQGLSASLELGVDPGWSIEKIAAYE
ncbi:MAG: tRNA (adenosine(37)-N6)-threonylcarbamoyltransferase complex transferase subunit TsaD [Bacilli bacterium]|jgi:N6-L-threonylcarbamoyladenine synthase